MKRALVISGGGSKGAFAVGVLKQWRDVFPGLHFDFIVGTSAGSLISPLASTEEYGLLEEIFTTTTTDDIVTKNRIGDRLNSPSLYTSEPLWQLIKSNMTDARYNQILQSGRHIYLITSCLQTEETVVYTSDPNHSSSNLYTIKNMQNAEHMRLAIMASSSQPVFMTPVPVDFNFSQNDDKNFQYVDGGVKQYVGIQMAIDQGATEIFSILLSADTTDIVQSSYTSLLPVLERTIDMFLGGVEMNNILIPNIYESALEYIKGVKNKMLADNIPQDKIDQYFATTASSTVFNFNQQFRLFTVRPASPLGGGPGGLNFDPVEMKEMVLTGMQAGRDFAANLDPTEITWA